MRCGTGARRRKPRSPDITELVKRPVAGSPSPLSPPMSRGFGPSPMPAKLAEREVGVVRPRHGARVQVARETGYLDGVQNFRGADLYGHFPPDKCSAVHGQPGEPRAALAADRQHDHPLVTLNKGDR